VKVETVGRYKRGGAKEKGRERRDKERRKNFSKSKGNPQS